MNYTERAEKEIREENCRDITTLPMYQTERYWRAEKLGWAMQMAIAERSEVLRLRDELETNKQEIKKLSDVNYELIDERTRLRADLSRANAEIQELKDCQINDLEAMGEKFEEIEKLQATLKVNEGIGYMLGEAQEQNRKLKAELKEARGTIERLNLTCNEFAAEIASLKTELEEKQIELDRKTEVLGNELTMATNKLYELGVCGTCDGTGFMEINDFPPEVCKECNGVSGKYNAELASLKAQAKK